MSEKVNLSSFCSGMYLISETIWASTSSFESCNTTSLFVELPEFLLTLLFIFDLVFSIFFHLFHIICFQRLLHQQFSLRQVLCFLLQMSSSLDLQCLVCFLLLLEV